MALIWRGVGQCIGPLGLAQGDLGHVLQALSGPSCTAVGDKMKLGTICEGGYGPDCVLDQNQTTTRVRPRRRPSLELS